MFSETNRRPLSLTSVSGLLFTQNVTKTNFDAQFTDRYWRIETVTIVENPTLEKQYQECREELLKKVNNWFIYLLIFK